MKILLLSGNYPPTKCGMADYAEQLCMNLKKYSNSDIRVISGKTDEITDKFLIRKGIPVYFTMQTWGPNELNNILDVVEKEKPNVIHLQYHENDIPDLTVIGDLPNILKNKFAGIKFITSLASFDLDNSISLKNVQKLVNFSDAITLTTDFDYNLIVHNFPKDKNKIFKVYDRPNIELNDNLTLDKNKIKEKYNIKKSDFLFIFFGFINKNKGIEDVFYALQNVIKQGNNAKLLIIGDLHHDDNKYLQEYYDGLKDLVFKLNLDKNIIWTGYVPDEEISSFLLCADAAIMPFRDGISGKRSSFWSVLNHRLPTISTYSPDQPLPEGLINGINVLLAEVNSIDNLTENILKLITNKHLCETIGNNGKQLVDQRYSWKLLSEELINIYKKDTTL